MIISLFERLCSWPAASGAFSDFEKSVIETTILETSVDFLLWWRLSNTAIAVLALVYLMLDFRVMRKNLDSRRLYLTFSLVGLLFAAVLGSINNIARDNALSPSTPIITASVLWCLFGLWVSRHDRPSIWKDFSK